MHPGPPPRDVGCFVAVARQLSFSRAAAGLGMSQPAVSQAIARLERSLGLRLFDRTSRDVQLSDAGKLLLPLAESLLAQVTAFTDAAALLTVPIGQSIRLAYCPLVGGLAAQVARKLAARQPGIEVELRTAGWTAASTELAQDGAVAALMSTPFPAGLATTARFHLPITHLAVPARRAPVLTTPVRLAGLGGHEILLPRARPPGSVWAQLADRLPPRHRPPAADDFDDLAAVLDLVAAGRGLLPVPHLLVQTVTRPDVRFVPLDTAGLRMTYGLVWPRERATAEVMALVQAVQETLRTPGRPAG
ncbi:MAG TPA: LysR family transcriptional regulator [Mycobacteriales bacterium]|nr:LysR family transcriptional regulator [Mycobacteriales bacterium]